MIAITFQKQACENAAVQVRALVCPGYGQGDSIGIQDICRRRTTGKTVGNCFVDVLTSDDRKVCQLPAAGRSFSNAQVRFDHPCRSFFARLADENSAEGGDKQAGQHHEASRR